MTPHRDEILHSTPTHPFAHGGPEWNVAVGPLNHASDREGMGVDTYAFDHYRLTVARAASRRAELLLSPLASKKALDLAFATTLHLILRREGRLDLHAAAVAPFRGEAGVLILGPKGSGKSSLTLALAVSGWTFSSDDQVLAWREQGVLRTGGLRLPFLLTEDAAARLPPGAPKGRIISSMNKRQFQPNEIFPGQYQVAGGVAALLFPERTATTPSALERLRPVDCYLRLIDQLPFLTGDPSARPCIDVARAIADLPAFVLRAGPDMLEPRAADALLRTALA